jgi:hypothetical protein
MDAVLGGIGSALEGLQSSALSNVFSVGDAAQTLLAGALAALPQAAEVDEQPAKRIKLEDGTEAVATDDGEGLASPPPHSEALVATVAPSTDPEGVKGLELEVEWEEGRMRAVIIHHDPNRARLKWQISYADGHSEWCSVSDDLTTLKAYGSVRTILWASKAAAVQVKPPKPPRQRKSAPAAPTPGGGGEEGGAGGEGDWSAEVKRYRGSAGTEYRYIFKRNGLCRAQITHQGAAIIRCRAAPRAHVQWPMISDLEAASVEVTAALTTRAAADNRPQPRRDFVCDARMSPASTPCAALPHPCPAAPTTKLLRPRPPPRT